MNYSVETFHKNLHKYSMQSLGFGKLELSATDPLHLEITFSIKNKQTYAVAQ